jgi:predicted DNA-binding transcriptional regulator AlpA
MPAQHDGPGTASEFAHLDQSAVVQAQPTPSSRPLSSWKEIALYLGKGVRTVQRWERDSQFPIHRPTPDRHRVVAYPHEIDAWVTKETAAPESPERKLERLCAAVNNLVAEHPALRDRARELCRALQHSNGRAHESSTHVVSLRLQQ